MKKLKKHKNYNYKKLKKDLKEIETNNKREGTSLRDETWYAIEYLAEVFYDIGFKDALNK